MNDVLLQALVNRIKIGEMDIEQVPIPYQNEIKKKLKNQK